MGPDLVIAACCVAFDDANRVRVAQGARIASTGMIRMATAASALP